MQSNVLTRTTAFLAAAMLLGLALQSAAQDKPAHNMESVHAKLKADKKLIVTKYMALTASEANKFWPVYEEYQQDLHKINQRLLHLLQSYAADYQNKSLTDDKAQKLLDEWIAIENDDAKRRASYLPKVMKVLPPKKAARYLQIENEYRILIKYDLAATVPLVQ
jgi:Spy/CpxP family protein refolding chaperone